MSRLLIVAMGLLVPVSLFAADDAPPKVGETAKDFELPTVAGGTDKLSEQVKEGPAVVVVLRGYPGYQCPICRRQMTQFFKEAEKFEAAGAAVLLIYPGDVTDLAAKAKEFLAETTVPDGFQMLLDPGYTFTNAWNLRWDEPRETAYPATFVVGQDRKIKLARVSDSHGGRTPPAEVLKALAE
jgi:peroxiredoxin